MPDELDDEVMQDEEEQDQSIQAPVAVQAPPVQSAVVPPSVNGPVVAPQPPAMLPRDQRPLAGASPARIAQEQFRESNANLPIDQAQAAYAAALKFQGQRQYQEDLQAGKSPAEALARSAPLLFSNPKQSTLGQAAAFIRATTPKPPPGLTPYQAIQVERQKRLDASKTVNVGPAVDRIRKLESQLDELSDTQAADKVKLGMAKTEDEAKKLPATGPIADEIRNNLVSLRQQVAKAQGQSVIGPSTRLSPRVDMVTTKAQYDALPSGAIYLGKNGRKYRKP